VPEATVVAWYDALPADLAGLVGRVQGLLGRELAGFEPRNPRQVHATVIRLDPGSDLAGLLGHLHAVFSAAPLRIQFGGFSDRDHAFASRSKRLYERSLTMQQGLVTLIGWPVEERSGSPTAGRGSGPAEAEPLQVLGEVRRDCQRFGAVHKYHGAGRATDPDAYMVVGEYDQAGTTPAELERAAGKVRAWLRRRPVRVRMGAGELRAVVYADRRLPPESTVALPLGRPGAHAEVARLLRRR
jgi:hypothetical protein